LLTADSKLGASVGHSQALKVEGKLPSQSCSFFSLKDRGSPWTPYLVSVPFVQRACSEDQDEGTGQNNKFPLSFSDFPNVSVSGNEDKP